MCQQTTVRCCSIVQLQTCSYFFLSTFLATLNTSTSKSKSSGKQGRSKKDEEEEGKGIKEKKNELGGEKKLVDAPQKPAKTLSSQIPKKTSPKKPLLPVKAEPSQMKKDAKRANCKYAAIPTYKWANFNMLVNLLSSQNSLLFLPQNLAPSRFESYETLLHTSHTSNLSFQKFN